MRWIYSTHYLNSQRQSCLVKIKHDILVIQTKIKLYKYFIRTLDTCTHTQIFKNMHKHIQLQKPQPDCVWKCINDDMLIIKAKPGWQPGRQHPIYLLSRATKLCSLCEKVIHWLFSSVFGFWFEALMAYVVMSLYNLYN